MNTTTYYKKANSDRLYKIKPDLQELYAQKEQERIEKQAQTDQCWKLMKECLDIMRKTLDEYPDDKKELVKTARFCVIWMKARLAEMNFTRLSKFDIERMWTTALEQLRRDYVRM